MHPKRTTLDLTGDGIDDAVDEWHELPAHGEPTLAEYLGMDAEQYAVWAQGCACRRCHGVPRGVCASCGEGDK